MNPKTRKRLIIAAVVLVALVFLVIQSCTIRTPEIHGVVLDAETKKPVEKAWIASSLKLKTRTVQGDVTSYLSLDKPHTRTDKEGRFKVPSKTIRKPLPPAGFGTSLESFSVYASTIDDRGGGDKLKRKQCFLFKCRLDMTIYVKPVELSELEYASKLRALYRYCTSGRFSVERRVVEEGCDDWELDYAIAKHEKFLERIGEPETSDQRSHYAGSMKQLAYLYKKMVIIGRL